MDTTSIRSITAEELFNMPNDGAGYELVKGELRRKGDPHKMSPSGFEHGTIVARLTGALVLHIESNDLGEVTGAETGFKLASDPDTVRAPDVCFVRRDRIPPGELTEKFWPGPPDLAVEVISPNDTPNELNEKVEDYLSAGVRLIWIVNPRTRTVAVYHHDSEPIALSESDTLDGMDVVAGFQCNVSRLFSGRH